METVYNLNQAYVCFIERFGIEPSGLLLHEHTFQVLKSSMMSHTVGVAFDSVITFRGMTIYRSPQMKLNEVKFVL